MEQTRENPTCPYCLCEIEEEEENVLCPACGVAHHTECWHTNGKCSVYGCDGYQAWNTDIAGKIAPKLTGDVHLESDELELSPRVYDGPVCMECGRPVKRGQLTCRKCRVKQLPFYDTCLGPSVLFLATVVTIITLLVKGLS